MDFESLKAAGIGLSGYFVQCIDLFDPIVQMAYSLVLIAYFLYLIKKIKRELK